jgi:hypothetical protein
LEQYRLSLLLLSLLLLLLELWLLLTSLPNDNRQRQLRLCWEIPLSCRNLPDRIDDNRLPAKNVTSDSVGILDLLSDERLEGTQLRDQARVYTNKRGIISQDLLRTVAPRAHRLR